MYQHMLFVSETTIDLVKATASDVSVVLLNSEGMILMSDVDLLCLNEILISRMLIIRITDCWKSSVLAGLERMPQCSHTSSGSGSSSGSVTRSSASSSSDSGSSSNSNSKKKSAKYCYSAKSSTGFSSGQSSSQSTANNSRKTPQHVTREPTTSETPPYVCVCANSICVEVLCRVHRFRVSN
ncbi:unnamed protein product [Phytophthora lilii]|uniref:Unnamed protein product n=1 Tax=Phytophthora lilii TaxID=2077276 RepID=A0A9W6UF54_9STRA|nr:unnamed protein product [Phytophthora lilii]